MMTERPRRVSARASSVHQAVPLPPPTPQAEFYRQRLQDIRAQQREEAAAARAMVLDVLANGGEIYCVQLAVLLGWTGDRGTSARGVSRAKSILMTMEEGLLLVSRLRLPKRGESGPGRRYYRLKKFEEQVAAE